MSCIPGVPLASGKPGLLSTRKVIQIFLAAANKFGALFIREEQRRANTA
jgi:hypothetical protein